MKLLFVAVALISVSLVVAEVCPNGGYCDGACCKSWFHYRCCPHVNGVCCAGGFQCCPAGKKCVGVGFLNVCVGFSPSAKKRVVEDIVVEAASHTQDKVPDSLF
uniref:U50-Deinotoxin-Dsu1a_1 n=1 Tax=Deinopis subrufa TaxID=1905329 RepID=A0A4Q8K7P3_DEISU